jgi:Tryptophan-associated transmembrane protein (Trp_oprn_chp)
VTPRREITLVLATVAAGALMLLAVEAVVGLVALAGAGAAAMLRPRPRTAVAVVLLLVAVVVVVTAVVSSAVLLAVGATLVAAASGVAAARSHRWPPPRSGPSSTAREPTARDTWDALDRGEDPTT